MMNVECRIRRPFSKVGLSLDIRHSFSIRHSSFVIFRRCYLGDISGRAFSPSVGAPKPMNNCPPFPERPHFPEEWRFLDA